MVAVCSLFISQTGFSDHVYKQDEFISYLRGAAGATGTSIEAGPLNNFLTENPKLAERIDFILRSSNGTPDEKNNAKLFIDSIPTFEKNPTLIKGAIEKLGIKDVPASQGVTASTDLTDATAKLTKFITDANNGAKTETLKKIQTALSVGIPKPPVVGTTGGSTGGETGGTTAGQKPPQKPSNSTAGATGGAAGGAAGGATAGKPPLTKEEKERQAAQDALLQAQLQDAQQRARGGGGGSGKGGGGGGGSGSGSGSGAGGGGSPQSFGSSQGGQDTLGEHSRKFAADQKTKDTSPGNLGSSNFGSNNNSSSDSQKDPFKKDDKNSSSGFKLPEPKTPPKSKTVAKPGLGKTDPLADPSGDAAEGPDLGYKNKLVLSGPSKVPNLAPIPDISAMLAAGGGAAAGGGGGGGDGSLAGSNIKGGGGGGGAAAFEGSPFNSNEGMGQGGPMVGAPFRKISPEPGAGTEGEGVESSSGGTNDFRKKGSILDQIITVGPDESERYKNLGVMAYVSRTDRICTTPGKALLANCPVLIKSRRVISREESE